MPGGSMRGMAKKALPTPTDVVHAVNAIDDAAARGLAATGALNDLASAMEAMKEIRQSAVAELVEAGWTYDEIGKAIGVTRGRAYQIGQGMSGSTAKG